MDVYILDLLRAQFRDEKQLVTEIRREIYNPDTNEVARNCSCIIITDIGLVYFNPDYKDFFYHGTFPGTGLEIYHFRLKRNFRHLLPFKIQELLLDSFAQKTTKKLVFSEQLEKELFLL